MRGGVDLSIVGPGVEECVVVENMLCRGDRDRLVIPTPLGREPDGLRAGFSGQRLGTKLPFRHRFGPHATQEELPRALERRYLLQRPE